MKFSQEIRTETRISNFNLKGSGPQYLRLGGGGDMFRIIYLRGDVFRIIHRKLKFGGDILGGFVPYFIPEGGCLPHFFPDRRFYSGKPILHFVIFTYDFIYLINLIG